MSNAGLKLREPVIGDDLDQATYGRPSTNRKDHAPRERRPVATSRLPRKADVVSVAVDSASIDMASIDTARINQSAVRTVKISGQATPARRSAQRLSERRAYDRPMARYDQHPDRAAQWALFLGVFMVVVAIVTGT